MFSFVFFTLIKKIRNFHSGEGHVLNFPAAVSSFSMCADIQTSYLNTTGKCLFFNVRWITGGSLTIYLRSEDMLLKQIKVLTPTKLLAGSWERILIALPNSNILHQLIIKFVKFTFTLSGIAIDDLSIRPCSDFG